MNKYHYLYKITNLITGEYYYGVHSTNNLNDGYFGSGTQLKNNIQTYGKSNFLKEILEFFPDRKSLMLCESKVVNKQLLKDALANKTKLEEEIDNMPLDLKNRE